MRRIATRLAGLCSAPWFRVPLFAFALSRAGILAVAYLYEPLIVDNHLPPPYHIRPDNVLLDVFAQKDRLFWGGKRIGRHGICAPLEHSHA